MPSVLPVQVMSKFPSSIYPSRGLIHFQACIVSQCPIGEEWYGHNNILTWGLGDSFLYMCACALPLNITNATTRCRKTCLLVARKKNKKNYLGFQRSLMKRFQPRWRGKSWRATIPFPQNMFPVWCKLPIHQLPCPQTMEITLLIDRKLSYVACSASWWERRVPEGDLKVGMLRSATNYCRSFLQWINKSPCVLYAFKKKKAKSKWAVHHL